MWAGFKTRVAVCFCACVCVCIRIIVHTLSVNKRELVQAGVLANCVHVRVCLRGTSDYLYAKVSQIEHVNV